MLSETQKKVLYKIVLPLTGTATANISLHATGGGSVNEAYRVRINGRMNYFLKINASSPYNDFFEKEKLGLEYLKKQNTIRLPGVIALYTERNFQLLLLEWVEQSVPSANFWTVFGEQLAALHQISATQFGFETNNYMGALYQSNSFSNHWTDFFIENRLKPQLKIAVEKKLLENKQVFLFEKLYNKLDGIFDQEKPALLHGDLWSGNYLCDENGRPVLIDPAIYYGHRNVDLAMTTLFGRFDPVFYEAYNYHYPLPNNYREQWDICNLYPLLIHLNLFGRTYLSQIDSILKNYA